jgi:putative endonuclease
MPCEHLYFVYILASERNGTLYVGVTNDLIGRIAEHRNGAVAGFTKRYDVKLLVYFEEYGDIEDAIWREKRIKRWRRAWKLALIEGAIPSGAICGSTSPPNPCHPGRCEAAIRDPTEGASKTLY